MKCTVTTKLWNDLPTIVNQSLDLATFRHALQSFMAQL